MATHMINEIAREEDVRNIEYLNAVRHVHDSTPRPAIDLCASVTRVLGEDPREILTPPYWEDYAIPPDQLFAHPELVNKPNAIQLQEFSLSHCYIVPRYPLLWVRFHPSSREVVLRMKAYPRDDPVPPRSATKARQDKMRRLLGVWGYDTRMELEPLKDYSTHSTFTRQELPERYIIRVDSQEQLDTLLWRVSLLGDEGRVREQNLEDKIRHVIPEGDAGLIAEVVQQFDERVRKITKTPFVTFNDLVARFESGGKYVWLKVGFGAWKRDSIIKEAHYLRQAWQHPVLRAIAPEYAAHCVGQSWGALFTYDTRTPRTDITEDVREYMLLRAGVLSAFGLKMCRQIGILQRDAALTDTFNQALIHTLMTSHRHELVYTLAPAAAVHTIEQIDEWVGGSPRDIAATVKKHRRLYAALAANLAGYEKEVTVINADGKQDNVFPGVHRPRGDGGLVRAGSPEFELARLGARDMNYYARAYIFFARALEEIYSTGVVIAAADEVDFVNTTKQLAFISAMRAGASMASIGRVERAKSYLSLAAHYAHDVESVLLHLR